MAETGVEEPIAQSVALIVKEEVRLPNQDSMSEDWTGQEDLHPFWLIRRQKEGDEINCSPAHRQRKAITPQCINTRANKANNTTPPTKPHSSANKVKIKSVCFSGSRASLRKGEA